MRVEYEFCVVLSCNILLTYNCSVLKLNVIYSSINVIRMHPSPLFCISTKIINYSRTTNRTLKTRNNLKRKKSENWFEQLLVFGSAN